MTSRRIGNQTPTFQRVTDYDFSDVNEAIELFKGFGFNLQKWQKFQMELMLAVVVVNDIIRVAAKTLCFSVPRQCGKSFSCRLYAIWCALILGKHVLYSAHHGRTCRKFFKMLDDIFSNKRKYPDLYDSVEVVKGKQNINRQRGEEGIYFKNGGCIEFQTRTNSGSRGDSVDVLIIDEAQEYTSAMQEGLQPCLSACASGDAQTIYVGTPITPKCHGDVWLDLYRKAHSDKPTNVWWVEWAYDGEYNKDLTTEELFELAWEYNPGLGSVLNVEDVYNEAETMTIDGYMRERLGWWGNTTLADKIFNEDEWALTSVTEPPNLKEIGKYIICYGVKISPRGDEVALCAAVRWLDENKKKHIYLELREIKDNSHGKDWLVTWLAARKKNTAYILIDGRDGAEKLRTDLIDAGIPSTAVGVASTNVATDACSLLKSLNDDRRLYHFASPVLDMSAISSEKKVTSPTTGAYVFKNGADGDCVPLAAASLAVQAAYTTKRDPNRTGKLIKH